MNDYFKTGNNEVPETRVPIDKGFGVLDPNGSTPVMDYPEIEAEIRKDSAKEYIERPVHGYKVHVAVDERSVDFHANEFDYQYQDNVRYILQTGEKRTDRTGVNTVSQFGDIHHKVDLRRGFPATTLKRLAFHANKVETIDWMLQGKFDLKTLKDAGVRIWDQNVKPGTEVYEGNLLSFEERERLLTPGQSKLLAEYKEEYFARNDSLESEWFEYAGIKLNRWGVPERALSDGYLGPIYGKQWRDWEDTRIVPGHILHGDNPEWAALKARGFEYVDDLNGSPNIVIHRSIDQVADLEQAVKNRSDSRRIILTGWNVAQLDEMQLPPCHTMAQWYVSQRKDENGLQYLDCKMYQRSADYLLGCPFNIAQYALITEMLAHVHGLRARFLYHTIGDAHLYQNHIDAGFVEEIVSRPIIHKSAKLKIEGTYASILDIPVEAITLEGYESHEAQKNVPIAK